MGGRSETTMNTSSEVAHETKPGARRRVAIGAGLAFALGVGLTAAVTAGRDDSAAPATTAPAAPSPATTPATTPATPGSETAPATNQESNPATSPAAPPASAAPPAPPVTAASNGSGDLDGNWSTDGADIVDAGGDAVQIRGVNWFGFETGAAMPHGLWQRNLGEMLDQIAGLGFNTIRLPFSSHMLDDGVAPQGINEQANPDLVGLTSLELMDRVVDEAGARGLAIILDRHALGADNRASLWYDAQFPHERLVADWELLATRYADRPNVIGADLYNEPHDTACWGCGDPATDWHAAATEAGDAIHAIEPEWLVFVEGVEQVDGGSCDGPDASGCSWWGGNLSEADTEPIELARPNKVVYSPHEYATSVFRQSWFDDPSFPANMPAIWDANWGDLERNDVAPVMVGEFGSKLDAEIDRVWMTELLAYLDEIDAGFTYWSFNPNSGDTGGILDDDWTTVDADKMSFLAPYLPGAFDPVGT
jgi:endoglucanase